MSRQSNPRRRCLRWYHWVLIVLGAPVLMLLLWWWLRRQAGKKAPSVTRIEITVPPPHVPGKTGYTEELIPSPADDLKRIEGIGPKISTLLRTAGVTTFAQLATTDVSRLDEILREAGITIADPTTWPEQASLAAGGEWDALETLQAELKGGRRV